MPNPYVSNVFKDLKIFASLSPEDFIAKAKYIDAEVMTQTAIISIDVLRMNTTMLVAAASGVLGISLAVKPTSGDCDLTPPVYGDRPWKFGGEFNGLPIQGASFSNSPLSIPSSNLDGKYIKFFSTNGAKAQAIALEVEASTLFLMTMANIESTVAEVILQKYSSVWFLCAGFYNSPCLEDTVCAGIAINHLSECGFSSNGQIDDGAKICRYTADIYTGKSDRLLSDIYESQVARLLCNIGHSEDVHACITGEGLPLDLYERMTNTVIQLQRSDGFPLLVPITF